MKTLVLGIGNPILGDDGVGVHVAQELAKLIEDDAITVEDASTSGLNLLDIIPGYDKVIIIDAIRTEEGESGKIYRLRPEDFSKSVHLTTSMHDANLPTVIEMGNKLIPDEMPSEIVIFAIEVEEIDKFTEEMTEKVKEAVPKVLNLVLGELGKK
ncbi:MAG TPA: hydrogenase maturation protease [Candidatus Bathyarchaeia archaeon]|nr:hydrogenase maturation protease [Candidatus Bathyarchaeia archaeon]